MAAALEDCPIWAGGEHRGAKIETGIGVIPAVVGRARQSPDKDGWMDGPGRGEGREGGIERWRKCKLQHVDCCSRL